MAHHTLIVWFRRDLRLADQSAFIHATRDAERVVPVFILDPALLAPPHAGGPRVRFLLESLRELDTNLRGRGSYLVVRQGEPLDVLKDLLRESNAGGVYFNREYAWPGRDRDKSVTEALRGEGVDVRGFADLLLVEPDALLNGQGKPYTVYTPYRNAWQRQPIDPPLPGPPERLRSARLATLPIPSAVEFGFSVDHSLPAPGEAAGLALLARFTGGGTPPIVSYKADRNVPMLDGTSRLSPHLRFGTVGVRTALAAAHVARAAGAGEGVDAWIGELAWRDFYYQWMWHYPRVLDHSFDAMLDDLSLDNDPALFAAWREGRTGFPIVDAAMRQLNVTGWMHNRLRMITASFLCKDLLIDWRWGERYFWEQLTCGDKPANVGGWQWSASTGVDPQPYFRMFNPRAQGERFDPQGDFVRQWLPELAMLPTRHIHAPQTLPPLEAARLGFVLDRDYPHPVIDHALQRRRALEIYARAKGREPAP